MSDRKYRQQGYQDQGRRERTPSIKRPLEPHDPRLPRDPKAPNMPGFRNVFRCGRCKHIESTAVQALSVCGNCGVPLHACVHCGAFDGGARFECREAIPARVTPKDARNECALFSPRISVERETGSTPAPGSTSARKAFDDLFKF
jgi:hypothetical protein